MFNHISVLLNESIEGLAIKQDGIYVDCTTGGAGHSALIADRLTDGRLICFDKDIDALNTAKQKLSKYGEKVSFIHSDFKMIKSVLTEMGIKSVDGILADLGVSSYQIDTAERGFSYMKDGPLDMRMDQAQSLTAAHVVNTYSEAELKKIMYEYGEEKNTAAIVRKIIKVRETESIDTTQQLKNIIVSCYPPKLRYKPAIANKVFQAIRIEVNGELKGLEAALEDMVSSLKVGGRIVIISFHTLEDRTVKQLFRLHATDCICPPQLPRCMCKHTADIVPITKKPTTATKEEQEANTRSISAKLRIAEKK